MPLILQNASFSSVTGNIEMSDPHGRHQNIHECLRESYLCTNRKKKCLDIYQGKLNFFYMKCLLNEDILFPDTIEIQFS